MIKRPFHACVVVLILLLASACTSGGTTPDTTTSNSPVRPPEVPTSKSPDASTTPTQATTPSTTRTSLQVSPVNPIDTGGAVVTTSPEGPAVPPATPEGSGTARCARATIAVLVDGAERNTWLGKNITTAAKAAAKAHNSTNRNCQVTVKSVEYQDNAKAAARTATKLAADDTVLAAIGPDSQTGLTAMAPILADAQIPVIPLGIIDLDKGKSSFAGNAEAMDLAKHVAQYLRSTKNLFKICVLHDGSVAAKMLAKDVAKELNGAFDRACSGQVSDSDATASKAHAQAPDGVFFAGATKALGDTITALRKASVTTGIYSAPIDGSALIKDIGSLAAGVTVLCPCAAAPAELRHEFDKAPDAFGPFSTEAYDLTTILLSGIDSGARNGSDLTHYLRKYDGHGYGGTYRWSKTGSMTKPPIWLYQIGV